MSPEPFSAAQAMAAFNQMNDPFGTQGQQPSTISAFQASPLLNNLNNMFGATEQQKSSNSAASQLAAISNTPTITGSPFGGTNTRQSLYQQPMQQVPMQQAAPIQQAFAPVDFNTALRSATTLFASSTEPAFPSGNFGNSGRTGSPQMQSAFNAGGNSGAIPLEGKIGIVKLAAGGEPKDWLASEVKDAKSFWTTVTGTAPNVSDQEIAQFIQNNPDTYNLVLLAAAENFAAGKTSPPAPSTPAPSTTTSSPAPVDLDAISVQQPASLAATSTSAPTWSTQQIADAGAFIANNLNDPAKIEAKRKEIEQATGRDISASDILAAAKAANLSVSGALADIWSGDKYGPITTQDYYNWINQGVMDRPEFSGQEAQAAMKSFGISGEDITRARALDPRFSAGAQFALTTPTYEESGKTGFAALNQKLRDYIQQNAGAIKPEQARERLTQMLAAGTLTGGQALNEYDVQRATGKTLDELFKEATKPKPFVPPPPINIPAAPSRPVNKIDVPGIDTAFRESPVRTFNPATGTFQYTNPTKLTPATGSGTSWVPPVITSRQRQLLNVGFRDDITTPTYDAVSNMLYQPAASSSQRFAADRSAQMRALQQLRTSVPMGSSTFLQLQSRLRSGEFGGVGGRPVDAAALEAAAKGYAAPTTKVATVGDKYFEKYPDVAETYAKLDAAAKAQFRTPSDYAQYHYDTYGRAEGREMPTLFAHGGPVVKKQSGGDVSRGTSSPNTAEVPQLDTEGRLIDENAEMRSEAQRMLNRLKTAQQESYRRGKLPPGIQRAVTDVMSEEKPPLVRGSVMQAGRDIVGGVVGATPTDPTNPSNLQRLVQGFTGAYLPTAPVGRTAQAVKTAVQEPRATMSAAGQSARESLKALGDIPVALAQPNQLGAQAGMVRLGGKESGDKPSSIFTPLPKADAPFVGRLDTFVSELPGPVRKDQFLGSLQGKFRDYEIKRAEEALKRLPDDAKLSPSTLLNQIKKQYDPSYYRTQVVEPQVNSFYYDMDNVYQGPRGDEFPMGVIHLIQSDNPQSASREVSKKLQPVINRTYGGLMSPEEVTQTREAISSVFGMLTSTDKRKLAKTWTPYARVNQAASGFEDISNELVYPVLNKEFMEARFKLSPIVRDAELAKIMQRKVEIAKDKYGVEGLDEHIPKLIQEQLGNEVGEEATNAVRELFAKRRKELNKELRESNADFRSVIRDIVEKENAKYRGQHAALLNENNPIAFSRFSEHTTDIPGLGTTKGIYVNELQSDRLDDIRKTGPYGGNPQKDLVNRLMPLQEKQAQLLNEFVRQKFRGAPKSKLDPVAEELDAINKRVKREYERVTEGTYSLRESFPGMEESPQVIQQLMAKNVISAAINRGVNFVAFPGAESKQAQLYEKLPNNLRQVVKDLGPGFEFRPVTLKKPDGQEITHPAVVWGPEAANRIKQKGVPFKDGGEVNVPRGTSTSKQQLDKLAQISQRKKA